MRGRLGPRGWGELAVLAALGWLTVGAFSGQRSLWHDEVQILFRQFAAPGHGWGRLFLAFASPARRLVGLPFQVALWSGLPLPALFAILTAAWLATAALAHQLARRLWPSLPGAAFFAAALTVTATGDFFTASLVTLHYVLSAVAALLALLALWDWATRGGAWRLGVAALALVVGFLLTDVPLSVYVCGPLLLAARPAPRRPVLTGLVVWYAAGVPYLLVVVPVLLDSSTYLSHALESLPLRARAARLADLLAFNLTPWRWSLARPLLFPREAPALVPGLNLALAGLGGAAAAALAALPPQPAQGRGGALAGRVTAALALLTLAANATYASVTLAQFHCRTQVLSGVWTALLLAAGLAWLASRGRAWRLAAALTIGAWVCLGVSGGLERQDYLVGHWRVHQVELASLRAAAPGLSADAMVLLRVPLHASFSATEAGYLARAWMVLMHADPTLECRVVLWADGQPNRCQPAADGLICQGERSPDCVRRDGRAYDLVPLDRLVWLDYDPQRRRFELRRRLDAALDPAGLYAPERQILERPLPELARALLDRPRGSFAPR